MTLGAIHVSQVPQSGWPRPLAPPIGCNLSTNRRRKPKWRRCVAASIAVGPSAILTGSRTRPSNWGPNARFGPVEDRRNNRRLATFTCTLCVFQIWWLSPFIRATNFRRRDKCLVAKKLWRCPGSYPEELWVDRGFQRMHTLSECLAHHDFTKLFHEE